MKQLNKHSLKALGKVSIYLVFLFAGYTLGVVSVKSDIENCIAQDASLEGNGGFCVKQLIRE